MAGPAAAQQAGGEALGVASPPGLLPAAFRDLCHSLLPGLSELGLGSVQLWQIFYFLLLLLAAWLAGLLFHKLLSAWAERVFRKLGASIDEQLFGKLRRPVTVMFSCAILCWGIEDIALQQGERTLLFLAEVSLTIAAVLLAYQLVGLFEGVLARRALKTDGKLDDQLVPVVGRSLKVAVVALGVVFVLQNQGVQVTSLVAGLSLGGAAIALASKDTVENLFGAVTIFVDRPFQIGDWIIVDGKWEGVVEEVGLRSTRIRTFGKSLISLPNGKVGHSPINNMGQRPYRRQLSTLGVAYDTPRETLQAYVARLNRIVEEHDETWKGTCEIHFKNFGASALEIMVYFFLDVPDWHRELQVRQEILLSFIQAAEELGVRFAFPSTSLYVEGVPELQLLSPVE